MKMLRNFIVAGCVLGLLACPPEEEVDGPGPGGPGVFSIDDYPAQVTSSPIAISGTKPAGFGVLVDGAERFAPGAATTWSVDLDLVEGDNTFMVAPVDGAGTAGVEVTVNVALDSIAPSVLSTTPASGAVDVPLNTAVTVVFSEVIDCATVTPATFAIQGVGAQLDCQPGATQISLTPDSELTASSLYTVTLFSDVADLAGNTMASDQVWQFFTGQEADTTPPAAPTIDAPAPPRYTFQDSAPVGGSKEAGSSVLSGGTVIVPADTATTWSYTFPLSLGDNAFSLTSQDAATNESTATTFTVTRVTGSFSVDAYPTLVRSSPVVVTGSKPTLYAVHVDSVEAVAADASETWSTSLTLAEGANSFTITPVDPEGTAGAGEVVSVTLDSTSPTVSTRVPSTDDTDVSISTAVQAVFDEAIDCATVSAATFTLSSITASPTCSNDTVSLTPPSALTEGTVYTITAGAAIADLAGNTLGGDVSWSFTTGITPDTTPPAPPTADSPAPGGSTSLDTMSVGGWKEADANVEFRWEVDGVQQQDWTQIAPKDATTAWSNSFDLNMGSNFFQLRSVDPSNNISATTTDFTVQRNAPVASPTVNVVSPTTVGNQIITGTKPADTAIWDGSTELVARDSSTTWEKYLDLSPGANDLSLTARNAGGESSNPVLETITYNVPPDVPGAARLEITFDLQDMWNYIGDEYWAGHLGGCNLNHFGIDIWLEGPITPGETCRFDAASHERRHTRYVATVQHGCYWNAANPGPPPAPCHNFWWEPNYRSPNYLAALIEAGWWESSTYPIPRDADRRNAAGEMWQPGVSGGQVNNPELYYPCVPPECPYASPVNSKPKMYQRVTDGMTEASVNAAQSDSAGANLGEWVGPQSVTWAPVDSSGAPLPQGPYLINITVTVDRTGPANATHYARYLQTDRETCWDDPAHFTEGMNRAEGIIVLGATDATLYLHERGKDTVDSCRSLATPLGTGTDQNRIRCSCDHTTWPCCQDARCPYPEAVSIPALVGGPVESMVPDKFADPIGDGEDYAVEVKYCPSGTCS